MRTVQIWNRLLFDSVSASLIESKHIMEGNSGMLKLFPQLTGGYPVPQGYMQRYLTYAC